MTGLRCFKTGPRSSLARLRRRGLTVTGVVSIPVAVLVLGASEPTPKPTTETETCTNDSCHSTVLDHEVRHRPVVEQKCEACHTYVEPREHRFRLATAANELCESCHIMQHRTVVHTPVATGDCTGCHDPHGSDQRLMLHDDPTRGLCLRCHSQDFADKEFVHGPVAAGACILCHEPHSGWEPQLLIMPANDLCADCHTEIETARDSGLHVHEAMEDGCGSCHDSHASAHKHQLKSAPSELCLTCHTDVADQFTKAKVVHGAAVEGDGCVGCHTPHSSILPDLQKKAQPEICLDCHDRPMETDEGRALVDMKRLLNENPNQHGPIRDGACSECHQPHAGEEHNLLVEEYPAGFYAAFDIEQYSLCFTCHIPDLVLDEAGRGLTRFRDGELNLHWLHVNQDKGRTCRACHEVHASKRPFHMRESVPFGSSGWMLEINFEQRPDGGVCAPGCHEPATYDRGAGDAASATRPPLPETTRGGDS